MARLSNPGSSEDGAVKTATGPSLDPERAVRAYLRAHPEVLRADPGLLAEIVGAPVSPDGRIVNFQGAVIQRLKERLSVLEKETAETRAEADLSAAEDARTRAAVLLLLEAHGFPALIATITSGLPRALEANIVALALEMGPERGAEDDLAQLGVHLLLPGEVTRAMPRARVRFSPGHWQGREDGTGAVGSMALVRLDLGQGRPPCLLVAQSADPVRFRPELPAEPYRFLGDIIERQIRTWLTLPAMSLVL